MIIVREITYSTTVRQIERERERERESDSDFLREWK
jgi:hypothetical protein